MIIDMKIISLSWLNLMSGERLQNEENVVHQTRKIILKCKQVKLVEHQNLNEEEVARVQSEGRWLATPSRIR